jgi:MoxR-vWA-beta-propeller ternary system domain bpX6
MIRAKRATLKGYRNISAVWFFKTKHNFEDIQNTVISLWHLNSKFFEFDQGFIFTFHSPRLLNCNKIFGIPLEKIKNCLISAELTTPLDTSCADITLLQENKLITLFFHEAKLIDLSSWINLSNYQIIKTDNFIESNQFNSFSQASANTDTRELFNKFVGTSSEERNQFLSALGQQQKNDLTTRQSARSTFSLLHSLATIFKFPLSKKSDSSYDSSKSNGTIEPRKPLNTKIDRWRNWFTRIALITKASKLIGISHANYLKKLMDKFESGDLQEALRHAIPLSSDSGSLGQALGRLAPRNNLTISRHSGSAASVNFGNEVEQHLRKLYRLAFERLDKQGKYDEAAFVLADLLRNKQEALDYLVTHDRLKLATELALSWDMPPETIIRLCCLAGEWGKAVIVAKRDNAFSQAITLLQKSKPEIAQKLRYLWAEHLINQGDWLAAVDAIWPIEDAQTLAIEWLKQAEKAFGDLGIHASIQLILKSPQDAENCIQILIGIIEDPVNVEARYQIAHSILNLKAQNKYLSLLLSKLIPWLIADNNESSLKLSNKQYEKLINMSSDKILKTDLPPVKLLNQEQKHLSQINTTLSINVPAPGHQTTYDFVTLSNNRFLIAQGESGVIIVNENMQTFMRYDIPCHRIVISDSRQIALLLNKLDHRWRTTRLDLVTHKKVDLGILDIDLFTPDFDGVNWIIVSNNRYLVIDSSNRELQTLWSLSDLSGKIVKISRNQHNETLMIQNEQNAEIWTYSLPSRRLYKKDTVPIANISKTLVDISASGRLLAMEFSNLNYTWNVHYKLWKKSLRLDLPINEPPANITAQSDDLFLILIILLSEKQLCLLINVQTATIIYKIEWPLDAQVKLHFSEKHIAFSDTLGRIITFDKKTDRVFQATLR